MVRTFGVEFAAFALQYNTDEKRDFIATPRKVISVNAKVIQKIKYVKERQVMKLVPYDEMVELGYVPDKRKRPIYNESLLAGQPLRPKKKKNVGDQVGKDDDKPEKLSMGMSYVQMGRINQNQRLINSLPTIGKYPLVRWFQHIGLLSMRIFQPDKNNRMISKNYLDLTL